MDDPSLPLIVDKDDDLNYFLGEIKKSTAPIRGFLVQFFAHYIPTFWEWLARLLHMSTRWASTLGVVFLFTFALTMITVDEYAISDAMWFISEIVLVSKAVQWKGFSGRHTLTRLSRVAAIVLSLALCIIMTSWTSIKRGDKPWTAFDTRRSSPGHAKALQATQLAPKEAISPESDAKTPNRTHPIEPPPRHRPVQKSGSQSAEVQPRPIQIAPSYGNLKQRCLDLTCPHSLNQS
jgi:hypothetical protein